MPSVEASNAVSYKIKKLNNAAIERIVMPEHGIVSKGVPYPRTRATIVPRPFFGQSLVCAEQIPARR